MIIALMGNDGSGKSTICNYICNRLKEGGVPVEIIPGFDHSLLQYLKDIVSYLIGSKMKTLQEDYSVGSTRKSRKQGNNILFKVWTYLVFYDCITIFVKAYIKRHKILIFDRYFYDHAISFEELGCSSRVVRKLFLLFPKPDIGIVFDAEPEIGYSRKKHDHTAPLDYYIRQRERYLNLAKRKELPVINTSYLCPDETSQEVFQILFEHPMFRRFSVSSSIR